jgi:hypothetical protein
MADAILTFAIHACWKCMSTYGCLHVCILCAQRCCGRIAIEVPFRVTFWHVRLPVLCVRPRTWAQAWGFKHHRKLSQDDCCEDHSSGMYAARDNRNETRCGWATRLKVILRVRARTVLHVKVSHSSCRCWHNLLCIALCGARGVGPRAVPSNLSTVNTAIRCSQGQSSTSDDYD